jgi:hypothetical protein
MNENPVAVESGKDPARIALIRARQERAQRNRDWLDAHLPELLPQAYGKLVAVAGQEAFIAETEEEAKAWARTAHPEDDGLVIRVVPEEHVAASPYPVVFEIETDPDELAEIHEIDRQAKLNSDWLEAHWADILPQARGKFLAVAGQEAFIADTHEEAWTRAKAAHPEDRGAISQHVRASRGPRIYAHHWQVAGG